MMMRTVLIVEDEPLIRMMLADALADEGYEVIEAGSVPEAVAALACSEVDALITDIDMPGGISGLDLVDIVHACSRLPTIVASGGHNLTSGDLPSAARFIAKPYRLTDMLDLLVEVAEAVDPQCAIHHGGLRARVFVSIENGRALSASRPFVSAFPDHRGRHAVGEQIHLDEKARG